VHGISRAPLAEFVFFTVSLVLVGLSEVTWPVLRPDAANFLDRSPAADLVLSETYGAQPFPRQAYADPPEGWSLLGRLRLTHYLCKNFSATGRSSLRKERVEEKQAAGGTGRGDAGGDPGAGSATRRPDEAAF
jgi:hypothetical protein